MADIVERNPELEKEVSVFETRANAVMITDDASFAVAGEMAKEVKRLEKRITDYWEPLRVAAKKTYDDVLGKKKEMLSPVEKAEKIIKGKMTAYAEEVERKRREREAEMRRIAQEEAERKLAEAIEAEKNGDSYGAEIASAEAEVYDEVAVSGSIEKRKISADGVHTIKSYKITCIDASKVPTDLNGVVIRPVDEKAVMALIRLSGGKIQIPGITYEETVNIAVRA